jgi:hypothetical protein
VAVCTKCIQAADVWAAKSSNSVRIEEKRRAAKRGWTKAARLSHWRKSTIERGSLLELLLTLSLTGFVTKGAMEGTANENSHRDRGAVCFEDCKEPWTCNAPRTRGCDGEMATESTTESGRVTEASVSCIVTPPASRASEPRVRPKAALAGSMVMLLWRAPLSTSTTTEMPDREGSLGAGGKQVSCPSLQSASDVPE